MEKEYNYIIRESEAVPRSIRRMGDAAQYVASGGVSAGSSSSASGGGSGSGTGHSHTNQEDLDRLAVGTADDYVRIRRWGIKEDDTEGSIQVKASAGFSDEAGLAKEAAYAEEAGRASLADEAIHAQGADEWLGRGEWMDQPVRTTDQVVFRGLTVQVADVTADSSDGLTRSLLLDSADPEGLGADELFEDNPVTTTISTALSEVAFTGDTGGSTQEPVTLGDLQNVDETFDTLNDGTYAFDMRDGVLYPIEVSSLGSGGETGLQRNLRIVNNLSSKSLSASKGDPCYLEFTFVSQERYATNEPYEDTGERGLCKIAVKTPNGDSYVSVKEQWIASGAVQKIDISAFLGSGSNQVKIEVEGEVTAVTTPAFVYTIQLTSLSLSAAQFNWWTAFTGAVTLPLQIGGNVSKVLHVSLTGESYQESYQETIGTAVYTETAYNYPVPHPGRTGVYEVSAYVANADGSIRTQTVSFRIICAVRGAAVKLMAVNQVLEKAVNWSENTLFEYAMYDGDAVQTSACFEVTKDGNTIYSSVEDTITTSARHAFSLPLEIETPDHTGFTITACVKDENKALTAPLVFAVDNALGYAAMPGAVLYVNPKTRTNRQSNYKDLVNEMNGTAIDATWRNMNWGNDGWMNDESGDKVLRLMASSQVTVDYKPFSAECARTGKTIEVDYKIDHVTKYTEPVITFSALQGGSFVGLNIYPDNILMHSQSLKNDNVQNLHVYEGMRTRLTLTIVPAAYGHSGFNLCILYINGRKNRTFTYENNDYFAHNGDIVIGSDYADVDVYGIRQYDSGLSSQGVFTNYLNWLEDQSKKETERQKNNIMDAQGTEIAYENCKDKYNTFVFDQIIPSLADQTARIGNLQVNWVERPEWNASITQVTAKGQGTSSMKYWIWNTRYQLDKKLSVVTYADGSTSTGKWQMTPHQPAGRKYTAKKNFASSMQSHKIGAVNSYTDLVREMGLLNEAMAGDEKVRVSVWEAPFICFEKSINEEGETVHTFRGLYTFGSDKGDNDTFGFDTAVYPGMLSIEGSDNSPLLTLFRVPWHPEKSRVIYNEGGEAWQYNGAKSWNYGAGETGSIVDFIPVYNFVYQCSPRFQPFEGTVSELNAQAAVLRTEPCEFWIAKEGDPNRYEVYYYEPAEGAFVPSDIGEGTIQLYQQLVARGYGLEAADLAGQTAEQQNELFIAARVAKFRAEAGDYWHIEDTLTFMNNVELNAGTDERAKNTYPYSFNLDASRWRWRVDDTDTRFDTTNRGLPEKSYSVETHDRDETGAAIWNGETNNFFNLMEMAFPDEKILNMRRQLAAMQSLGGMQTGDDLAKLYAFYKAYYFDLAQEYFPAQAYNADAKYCYENGKLAYRAGTYSNDTDPITQSLGDHYYAEMRWTAKRMIYMMSKYSFGLFSAAGTDTITVRAAGNTIRYALTPAMDLYPAIANGTSIIRGERTPAGEVCVIDVELSGSGDQQNAIMGASYLQDIGDWYDKNVQGSMGIQGRMLREIRLGHKTEPVSISITSLTLSNCVSLQKLLLSGIRTLGGTLNLTSCTHLKEVYIDGTSVTQLRLPDGGGLKTVEFNALSQYLILRSYPLITNEGVGIDSCRDSIIDLLIQDCPLMQPVRILTDIIHAQAGQTDHALKHIRLTDFEEEYDGTAELYSLHALTDRTYGGLNAAGEAEGEDYPVLDGVLHIHARVDFFKIESLNSCFPKLVINADEVYTPKAILTFKGVNGQPVTGALFSCNVESRFVTKVSDTVYEILAPVLSTIEYTYISENYAPVVGELVVPETESGTYNSEIRLTYMPLVTISVRSTTGNYLSGAAVTLEGETVWSDTSGSATFRMWAGTHAYSVTYKSQTQTGVITVVADSIAVSVIFEVSLEDEKPDVNGNIQLLVAPNYDVYVRVNSIKVSAPSVLQINWGDGTFTEVEATSSTGEFNHKYEDGIAYHQIEVSGCEHVTYIEVTKTVAFWSIGNSQITGLDFYYNKNLVAVGSDIFCNDTARTSMQRCFGNCTALRVLPEGLFDPLVSVTTFESVFSGCESLETIPDGLFAQMTQLEVLLNIFKECTALKTVPFGVFGTLANLTSFEAVFSGCTALERVPEELFSSLPLLKRFDSAFKNCSSLQWAPELWNWYGDSAGTNSAVSKGNCFYNCSNAENYAEIPSKWK